MSHRSKWLLALTLCITALGPALTLPALSAHAPTLTAPASPAPDAPRHSPFTPFALPAIGAIKVKDAATVAAKWKTRAQAAQQDYVTAASAAGATMEANAIAAEPTYTAAVTAAASAGHFSKGLRGSGAKYNKNVAAVGGTRFQQGVANGQDAMAAGIAPVLQTIAGLTLKPRGIKGTNQENSNIVATALHKAKFGA